MSTADKLPLETEPVAHDNTIFTLKLVDQTFVTSYSTDNRNSMSTICPWVYTTDVCANVYKAKILTDIVSKVMANVPPARNAELSSQLSEDGTESPSFET